MDKSPTVLVLGAGGSKGLAILGALDFYYGQGYLNTVTEYWGTSVGSIISLLLVLGYTPFDIFHKFFTSETFTDSLMDFEGTFNNIGLCPIESLTKKFKEFTMDKLKGRSLTFQELYREYPKRINIIGTNVDKSECVVFNVDNFPDVSVFEAIEISSDIPLLFTRKEFRGDRYTDGALINEFPVDLASLKMNSDDDGYLLGIYTKEFDSDYWIYKLISVPIKELHRRRLEKVDFAKSKILELSVKGSITDLTPTKKRKIELYSSGYSQARDSLIKDVIANESKYKNEKDGWDFAP